MHTGIYALVILWNNILLVKSSSTTALQYKPVNIFVFENCINLLVLGKVEITLKFCGIVMFPSLTLEQGNLLMFCFLFASMDVCHKVLLLNHWTLVKLSMNVGTATTFTCH